MGVAAVGGRVYVVGGFDGTGQPIATVEAYAVTDNRWTQRASLPAPLHHVNIAAAGGKLYVVGALTGTSFAATGTTLVYDPTMDAWSALSSDAGRNRAGRVRGRGARRRTDRRRRGPAGGDSVADASVFDSDDQRLVSAAADDRRPRSPRCGHARRQGVRGRRARRRGAQGRARGPRSREWTLEPARPTSRPRGAAARRQPSRAGWSSSVAKGIAPIPTGSSTRPRATIRPPTAGAPTRRCGQRATASAPQARVSADRPGGATREGFGAVAVNESFGYQ